MARTEWVELVKAAIGVEAAATALGLTRGRGAVFGPCPLCHAATRSDTDRRPACGVGREKGRWQCWRCNKGGDVLDLVAAVRLGTSTNGFSQEKWAVVREACVAFGWVQAADTTPSRAPASPGRKIVRVGGRQIRPPSEPEAPWDPGLPGKMAAALWTDAPGAQEALDYLLNVRRFSEATIRAWGLGGGRGKGGATWVTIPLCDTAGTPVNLRFRFVPPPCDARAGHLSGCGKCDACRAAEKAAGKYRVLPGRPLPLFGADRLGRDYAVPVLVTEGELDVIALYEYGWHAGCVSGTGGAGTLKDEWLDELEPYRSFLLLYDGDEKGDAGALQLADRLGRYRCSRVRLPAKDAGECLATGVVADVVVRAMDDGAGMLDTSIRTIGSYAQEIEDRIARPYDLVGRPTGVARLDAALGGLRPGLIIGTGETGHGKAQPVDEPVLTPHGWCPIGKVRVGDYVIGSGGAPIRVLGVFPQGEREVCAVRFSDGVRVRCDWNHLWAVNTDTRAFRGSPYEVRTTRELASDLRTGSGRVKWRVPVVQPIGFRSHGEEIEIDPYVLGVLLGDGSLTNGAIFTKADRELHEMVGAALRPGYRLSSATEPSGAIRSRIVPVEGRWNAYLDEIRRYGLDCLSVNKFVPSEYMAGTVGERFALLQGLLDTDGGVEQNAIHFGTSSRRLAADVAEIVRSLGGIATTTSKVPSYTYKGEKRTGSVAYNLLIVLPDALRARAFRLERKRAALGEQRSGPLRKIEAIEADGRAECVCIAVDAPDRLYVTRDYVLTHNTTWMTWLLHQQARAGFPSLLTSFEQAPIGTVEKLLRMEIGTDYTTRTREERAGAMAALDQLPLYVVNHRGMMGFAELHDLIRYAVRRLGVRNVLIDHLGFVLDADSEDERREIQTVVRALSIIGEHEGVSIILICHPSNQHVQQKRRVSLADLKGASALRQDAHEVWVIERSAERAGKPPGTLIHLDKIRSDFGSAGSKVLLAFDPLSCSYADTWQETPAGKRGVNIVVPSTGRKMARRAGKAKDAGAGRQPGEDDD